MANRTVTNLTAILQMNNTKFKKGLSGSQKAMKGFQKQIKAVSGMLAGAFAVGALVNFGKEAVKLAAKAEGIRTAFEALDRPDLLDNLKQATRDTVSEINLMQAAVRAKNFKVPLEKLGTFFQFATDRAIQTGESVDYLVNSIIDGIGRKSTLVMDNLGISATELQEEIKLVGDFGQAAANIIEREMIKAGVVLDTTAIKMAQMNAAWEDWKEGAGGAAIQFLVAANNLVQLVSPTQKYTQEVFAQKMMLEAVTEAMEEYNKTILQGFDIADRFSGIKGAKEGLREYRKLMETVKTVDAGGLTSVEDAFFSGLQGLDWSVVPNINEGLSTTLELSKSLDEAWEEWAEIMEDDVANSFFPTMDKMQMETQKLGQMVGVMMVQQFDSLGEAIGRSLNGAEDALNDLGQAILANLGNILIMAGLQMGPAGLPLIIAGAGLQLGSGLIRGLGSSTSDSVQAGRSGGGGSVNFNISGRNLTGVLERNSTYQNQVT